ncbi:MAG: poly-gamma-glutamate system protein [Calditrichaeota bacterium]|nr:poly-gamma-glutamate system protein [Calditrichota bacterium]MCB9366458.1 poly-gamma-glutamate system protein [Calditrichota bacterium]MCB9391284.1 poly-gamma-glutamate system protein [Calditrichota bacterium]
MAFRPSLRSIWTLISMAVVCYGLYLWAEYQVVEVKQPHYAEKLAAAELDSRAMFLLASIESRDMESLESYGDERLDALIGQQFSTITTDIGSFESKLNCLNPNFAAAALELLIGAGLEKGDLVAVALTGSNPGANLAVLSACQVLGLKVNVITSIGSTWWGANDPHFTWVDMQSVLRDKKLLDFTPIAASRGGLDDLATGLSGTGRDELDAAAARNGLKMLSATSADQAGKLWWETFKAAALGDRYAAYVNVGEGVASTGHTENGRLLSDGVHRRLPSRNWPARGALHFASAEGIPVIHFYDMTQIAREFGLGTPRIPLTEPGIGDVFTTERYDVRIASLALLLAVTLLFILVRIDAKYFRLADAGVEPESLL